VKKAIELIKHVIKVLRISYSHTHQICIETLELAVEALEHPRRETPEQYEKRTGKRWNDEWPVWIKVKQQEYGFAAFRWCLGRECRKVKDNDGVWIICANCDGPPLENWEPEKGEL
jgi:hypothetical protein